MSNWKIVKLYDIGKIVTGKTPETIDPANYGSDYMFLGPTDLHKHFIISESEKMISTKGLLSIKGSVIDGLSILVGCIGWDMGNVALVKGKCATNQQINSVTQIKESYNPFYIYYWFKQKKQYLFQIASVTRTPMLKKTDFSNIELNIPNKNQQDKVSNILTALDSKIELNNRIVDELEVSVKTLYDYWFVQFDFPNEKGNPYKSQGGKMYSNFGFKREIPDNWKKIPLDDFCEIYQPKTISGKDLIESGKYLVYGSNSIIGRYNQYNHEKSEIAVSCRGNCGNIFRTIPKSWITGNAMIFKLKDQEIHNEFLYQSLHWVKIKNTSTGSVQGQLTRSNVAQLNILLPPKDILLKFNKLAEPIVTKKLLILEENQKLTELRDWLLPMLMNGQIKVK